MTNVACFKGYAEREPAVPPAATHITSCDADTSETAIVLSELERVIVSP